MSGGPSEKETERERGQRTASTALSEKGSSAVERPLDEGTIWFAAFGDRMHRAGHFGGNCCIRLLAQMGVLSVFRNVAFELVTETVGSLQDGDLASLAKGFGATAHFRIMIAWSGRGTCPTGSLLSPSRKT
jgi:hypothetical protein